jgi:hypothetical protein
LKDLKGRALMKGINAQLLQLLLDHRGVLRPADALNKIYEGYVLTDSRKLLNNLKSEVSKLRGILRQVFGAGDTKADPLPWDDVDGCWRAKFQIGGAVLEVDHNVPGERRLWFMPREQL